jgi:hypothetical protein
MPVSQAASPTISLLNNHRAVEKSSRRRLRSLPDAFRTTIRLRRFASEVYLAINVGRRRIFASGFFQKRDLTIDS